jgi:hypothetical protein
LRSSRPRQRRLRLSVTRRRKKQEAAIRFEQEK